MKGTTDATTSGDRNPGPPQHPAAGTVETAMPSAAAFSTEYAAAILSHSPYGHIVTTSDGRILAVNATAAAITGQPVASLIGTNALDYVHPDDIGLAMRALDEIGPEIDDRDEGIPILLRVLRSDGTTAVVETGAINQLDTGLDALCLRLRPYDAWMHLESFMGRLARAPTDAIELDDLVGYLDNIIQESQASIGLGWTGETFTSLHSRAMGPDLRAAQLAADPEHLTPWAQAIDSGELVEAEVSSLPERIAAVAAAEGMRTCWAHPVRGRRGHGPSDALVVWRNRTSPIKVGHREALRRAARATEIARQRHREHQALVRAARLDPLTGLANRSRFFASLSEIAKAPGGGAPLLYLDLDDFKVINDHWGHGYGDRVLRAVADAIAEITDQVTDGALDPDTRTDPADPGPLTMPSTGRSPDRHHADTWLVARLGGDEFAVLGPAGASPTTAERLAEALVGNIALSDDTDDGLRVRLSAGLAVVPEGGCDPDTLLESADAGLYAAKRAGRGTWAVAGT